MAKTEIYSWRLSLETKAALEESERHQRASISELLDQIVGEWLAQQDHSSIDEDEQQRLQVAALQTFGTLHGDDPDRSSNVKARLRAKFAQRRAC